MVTKINFPLFTKIIDACLVKIHPLVKKIMYGHVILDISKGELCQGRLHLIKFSPPPNNVSMPVL